MGQRIREKRASLPVGAPLMAVGPQPPAGVLVPQLISEQGFSDGLATEVGVVANDLYWDTSTSRLLVADCEVVREIDPAAGTSTVIAVAATF